MSFQWPYESIWDFLDKHNLKDKGQEVIAKAKAVYWKEYRKRYQDAQKETHSRVMVCLERDECDAMRKFCKEHNMRLSEFGRAAIRSRLGQQARMDEGSRSVLQLLSGMEFKLEQYLKSQGQVSHELPALKMAIRDAQILIKQYYDIQG